MVYFSIIFVLGRVVPSIEGHPLSQVNSKILSQYTCYEMYMCNDCVPACMVGLGGHSMVGTVLYCRSTVTGCSGW